MATWVQDWLGCLGAGCACWLVAAASVLVCRALLRRRRFLPAAPAALLAILALAPGAWFLFVAAFLMLFTSPAHPPEALRADFGLETGLVIPARWKEVRNYRTATDWWGDWTGILVFEIEPGDVDRLLNRRSGGWPRPEDFLVPGDGPGGDPGDHSPTNACDAAPGPGLPPAALVAHKDLDANREVTVAVDPADGRLYYCRFSW